MNILLSISFSVSILLILWAVLIARKAGKLHPNMVSSDIWELYFKGADVNLNSILRSALQKVVIAFFQFIIVIIFVLIYNMSTGNFKW